MKRRKRRIIVEGMIVLENDGQELKGKLPIPHSSACFQLQLRVMGMVSGHPCPPAGNGFPSLSALRLSSGGPRQSCDLSKQESILGEPCTYLFLRLAMRFSFLRLAHIQPRVSISSYVTLCKPRGMFLPPPHCSCS